MKKQSFMMLLVEHGEGHAVEISELKARNASLAHQRDSLDAEVVELRANMTFHVDQLKRITEARTETAALAERLARELTAEQGRRHTAERKLTAYLASLNLHRDLLIKRKCKLKDLPTLPPTFQQDNTDDIPF